MDWCQAVAFTGNERTMSDSELEKAHCSAVSTPKKKIKTLYKQSFKQQWMTDENFKDWVKPDPSDKYSTLQFV